MTSVQGRGRIRLIFSENVTALDRETGRKLWEYDPGDVSVRRFAMSSDRSFLLDSGAVLHCLLTATGELVGKVKTGMFTAENMLIDNGRLYVVGTMQVFALDLDGRTLWEARITPNKRHSLSGMGVPGGPAIQPDSPRAERARTGGDSSGLSPSAWSR